MAEQADNSAIITHTPTAHGVCQFLGTMMLHVHCQSRPHSDGPNEDAVTLIPVDERNGVLALADGFGGQPGGDQASRLALASMRDAVAVEGGQDLRAGILNGFEAANGAVLGLGIGAGTTMIAVEIADRTARIYHVGDSVALIVGQRGRLKYQTIPHSPVRCTTMIGTSCPTWSARKRCVSTSARRCP